jgi:hypothetical protein
MDRLNIESRINCRKVLEERLNEAEEQTRKKRDKRQQELHNTEYQDFEI